MEVQLQRDQAVLESDRASVRRRDAEIAQEIGAAQLSGRPLFLAWIDRIRKRSGSPAPGEQVQAALDALGAALFILGLVLGGGAVAGWLRYNPREPVNVVFFWSALVGLQMLLVMLWLIVVTPASWLRVLPGASSVQLLLRGLEFLPPLVVGWISTKVSHEKRLLFAEIRGAYRRWDFLYSRIRLWLVVRLTQVFALAWNLGAIVVFVALSYGTDPAFGWKSRLMTPEQLHRLTQVVSFPWTSTWESAAPSLEDVRKTQYSSLEKDFRPQREDEQGRDAWASWWPFLLASMLLYGLAPRALTWLVSAIAMRRALSQVILNHSEFVALRERLQRPVVRTQAIAPGVETAPDELQGDGQPRLPAKPGVRCGVIRWAGVPIEEDELRRQIYERSGAETTGIHIAGDLDVAADTRALESLAEQPCDEVFMLVESWEPPVGEYLDFLKRLRESLGRDRMIRVLLYNRDATGAPSPPAERDGQVWRRQIRTTDDPWLSVEDFVEEPQDE